MRTIETPRLVLEPQTVAHASEMFAVLSDPAIYEFENEAPRSEAWLAERFGRLESRRSPDATEQWLNWVVRLRASGQALGYVQATVRPDAQALIAYEMGSSFWGRGFGREAVAAMILELAQRHRVATVAAVFKKANRRSRRLLDRLGFGPATRNGNAYRLEADEEVMERSIGSAALLPK